MENHNGNMSDQLWTCVCGDGVRMKVDVEKMVDFSGYFAALLRSKMRETREKEIDFQLFTSETITLIMKAFAVKDISLTKQEVAQTFKTFLQFDTIEEVLQVVDYLDMPCLYTVCCEMLIHVLPVIASKIDKVWKLWHACQTYGLGSVEKEMFTHYARNLVEISKTDHLLFRELPMELLYGILSMPDIDILSELDIVKLIYNWIVYFPTERRKCFDTLFKCVHVSSLLHVDFDIVERMIADVGVPAVDIKNEFKSYISNPLKYLATRKHQIEVRNGVDIVFAFGGVYEQYLGPHNQTGENRRRSYLYNMPMLYQLEETVARECLNCCRPNKTKFSPSKSSRKLLKAVRSSDDDGLQLKTFKKFRSPMQLVDFGICTYENFIFLTGGQAKPNDDTKYAVQGAYKLDPHIGEWSEVAHMKEARCLYCLCNNWGCLFAIGGANRFGVHGDVEYYVPEEDKWYDGPKLPMVLHEHAGCVMNGNIYISGGHNSEEHTNKVWVLESKAGPWVPVAPMLQARSRHTMTCVGDKLYVMGGCARTGEVLRDIYSVEEYDSETDLWMVILVLNVPINCCLPINMDDEVLFIGGYSFETKQYLQQATAVDVHKKVWKVTPFATDLQRRLVGYYCLKIKVKSRILL